MGSLDGRAPSRAKWGPGNGAWSLRSPHDRLIDHQEAPMPGTELRGPAAHSRIGPQRGHLREAANTFQAAAGDVTQERDAWIAGVGGALSGLGQAWQEHVEFTEGRDGLFEELLDESVEVAPEIDHLRRDHEGLAAAMNRTRERLV